MTMMLRGVNQSKKEWVWEYEQGGTMIWELEPCSIRAIAKRGEPVHLVIGSQKPTLSWVALSHDFLSQQQKNNWYTCW